MNTLYFKFIAQKTYDGKTVLVAVIPDDILGENMPPIVEGQAFFMPPTIYTGTYPQVKFNPETFIDVTEKYRGQGVMSIVTETDWYLKSVGSEDILGLSIK